MPSVTSPYAASAYNPYGLAPPPPPPPPPPYLAQPSNPFTPMPYQIPASLRPHSVASHVPPISNQGVKRDASGMATNMPPQKAAKIVPTTAAAAAQSVAAAAGAAVASSSADADKKNKNKEGKDKKKRDKKIIRAAAGQTWEDESLLEWVYFSFLYLFFVLLFKVNSP